MREGRNPPARRLILLGLNEINFDVAARYLENMHLPALSRLVAGHGIRTTAEQKYESLEPWIQWPSVHSGLSATEHGIYRLGDIVHNPVPQFFEQLEKSGVKVGAVSPMNASNELRDPAYFIPDPWTQTKSDGSYWSRVLGAAVSQAVNDNSRQALTPSSAIHLVLGLVRFAKPRHYAAYVRLAARSRAAPWRKALFLDLFLHDLHMSLYRARNPGFSTLFLNAGAHIQHHYFFNARALQGDFELRNPSWYVDASVDPFAEMLEVYDLIIGDYLSEPGTDLIVATGLSQKPYDRLKFYYRLKKHAEFLKRIGIKFSAVVPRMTRDFLIEFADSADALAAQRRLENVRVNDGIPLFEEIDNRGSSLFVTLTYPSEITGSSSIVSDGLTYPLAPDVTFVALKNGMHQSRGFAYFNSGTAPYAPQEGDHVKSLHRTVERYFDSALRNTMSNAETVSSSSVRA